jgi:hypothetical protein
MSDVPDCLEASAAEQDEDWSPYLPSVIMSTMTLREGANVPAYSQSGAVLLELARYGDVWVLCLQKASTDVLLSIAKCMPGCGLSS